MKKRQAHSPYHHLPKELRELIAHTDKGVQRLYQSAAMNTSSTVDTSIRSGGRAAAEGQRRRAVQVRRDNRPTNRRADRGKQRRHGGDQNSSSEAGTASMDGEDDVSLASTCSASPDEDYWDDAEEGAVREPLQPQRSQHVAAAAPNAARGPQHRNKRHEPLPSCRLVEQHRRKQAETSLSFDSHQAGERTRQSDNLSRAHDTPSRLHDSSAAPDSLSATPKGPFRPAATPFTANTKKPALSSPSAATHSLFLSPEKSGYGSTADNTANVSVGARSSSSQANHPMRTRFGQKWSQTFQALFASAEGPQDAPPASSSLAGRSSTPLPGPAAATSPSIQQQVPQRPSAASAVVADRTSTTAATAAAASSGDIPKEEAVGLNGLLVFKLREELKQREHDMVQLRLDHALETASLKELVAAARREAAAEATQQAVAAHEVKQDVLRSALQVEQQRVNEIRAQLDELRLDKATAEEQLRAAEARVGEQAAVAEELKSSRETCGRLREALAEKEQECRNLQQELAGERQRCQGHEGTSDALRERVGQLERELLSQEQSARDTLRSLEEEFTATTDSYQQLLTEATKRMTKLEKTQRRYKALREANAALKEAAEAAHSAHTEQATEWVVEKARLSEELSETKKLLAARDDSMRGLSLTHEAALMELKRQSEAQRLSSSDQSKQLHAQLDTANNTIQLLRSQVEGLKREVAEEQAHGQELAMRMAETELRLQEEKQSQQRAAGAYKVQSEETIAALRRQLKEKDGQLKALAASQSEPLQRLRGQLDDERGRRALLEEQFAQYKRKAKEAEEAALLELRREKLRSAAALLTPRSTPTAASHVASAQRSASGAAAPRGHRQGTSTPKPWHSVATGGGNSSGAPSTSARGRAWAHTMEETPSPPRLQVTTMPIAESAAAAPPVPRSAGATASAQVGRVMSPAPPPLSPPSPLPHTKGSAREEARPRSRGDRDGVITAPPPSILLHANSSALGDSGVPAAAAATATAAEESTNSAGAPSRTGRTGAPTPAPSAGVPGVDSISGIALNTPCKSASSVALSTAADDDDNDGGAKASVRRPARGEVEPDRLTAEQRTDAVVCGEDYGPGAAAAAAMALLGRESSQGGNVFSGPSTPLPPGVHRLASSVPKTGASDERRPWYQYRVSDEKRSWGGTSAGLDEADNSLSREVMRAATAAYSVPAMVDAMTAAAVSRSRVSPATEAVEAQDEQQLRDQNDRLVAEQAREQALSGDHERRMRDFHASAAQVFHRITTSRDDFMAQCTAIVRQSSAAQLRASLEPEGALNLRANADDDYVDSTSDS